MKQLLVRRNQVKMKWSLHIVNFFGFSIISLSFVKCYWTESSQESGTRKSWRFTLETTPRSTLNKYNVPQEILDIPTPPCIDGNAECIFLMNEFAKYVSKLNDKSVLNLQNQNEADNKYASNHTVAKLNNLYPKKPVNKNIQHKKPASQEKKAEISANIKLGTLKYENSDDVQNVSNSNPLNSTNATNNTEGRIIAYKLNRTRVIQPAAATVPTVTLGQLARQVIFPEWFWTRFATNRKIGNVLPTTNITAFVNPTTTIAPPRLPTVTFDNNFSRFMKLFTMVRFQNTPCLASSGRNGTCYHSRECSSLGGTADNSCASGFGVCCVFQNSCGESTSRNGTYFVDNAMTFRANAVNTCTLQILKTVPTVKQMRLDFHVLSLQQPNAGNCELDRFIVSGQNTNDIIPILCGENNNTHLYVETEGSSTGIQLSIMTTGVGFRAWSIQITQFEVTNPSGAPTSCLQYSTGVMGTIRSFNYVSPSSPQYLNNLNYAICIRKEAGFCSVTFTNSGPDGTYMPFQIVNANDNGHLVIPSGQAGVGVRDCPFDYLLINGYRLCGERLNDATTNVLFVEDAPVTDVSNGPFIVTVRTNELDVGGGFFLFYRQNPCMSTSG